MYFLHIYVRSEIMAKDPIKKAGKLQVEIEQKYNQETLSIV